MQAIYERLNRFYNHRNDSNYLGMARPKNLKIRSASSLL